MKNWKESFHPYAMITTVCWSLAYVLTRIALRHFSVFSLGFLRYFIASLTLFLIAVMTKIALPKRSDLKWFVAAGTAGFFLYMIFFNKGCETVTSSTSSILIATVPVMTALLARVIMGELLNGYQWAAILLEFTGVILLTLTDSIIMVNKGVLWLILAAVSLSIYNLLQRKLTKAYSALQTSAFSIFSGTIMLSIFSPIALKEVQAAPASMMASVLILGIFSSAVAYVAWSQALSKAEKISSVSNYMFITPFLASLLGFVLAGEKPESSTITGGAVILSGMIIFYFGEKIWTRAFHK